MGKNKKFKREKAWIYSKINNGVSQKELFNSVGIFSDKKKEDVMKKKNLSSKQYDKRFSFLSNVYYLLDNYNFER